MLDAVSFKQVLIQFPDDMSASNAKNSLDGHSIYDGGFNRVSLA